MQGKRYEMSGKYVFGREAEREALDWGDMAWLSRPSTTGAGDLVVIEVVLKPAGHLHPIGR